MDQIDAVGCLRVHLRSLTVNEAGRAAGHLHFAQLPLGIFLAPVGKAGVVTFFEYGIAGIGSIRLRRRVEAVRDKKL